jgi:di/tricarboxylate transporter
MAAQSAISVGRGIFTLIIETSKFPQRKKILAKTRAPMRRGTKEGKLQPEVVMLWTIFVILLVLWLLGLVSSYTLGGFIHILLVLAIIVLIINLVSGRRGV